MSAGMYQGCWLAPLEVTRTGLLDRLVRMSDDERHNKYWSYLELMGLQAGFH